MNIPGRSKSLQASHGFNEIVEIGDGGTAFERKMPDGSSLRVYHFSLQASADPDDRNWCALREGPDRRVMKLDGFRWNLPQAMVLAGHLPLPTVVVDFETISEAEISERFLKR